MSALVRDRLHPGNSHWCCDCGNYEISVFSANGNHDLRIRCKRCKGDMRLGTHEHDDRLEPSDATIAALQAETVRQRERDENLLAVEKYALECSAEDLLNDAAVLLRAFEAKKGESP